MSIRVLIADDHRIVREGLRSLLEKESDMEVIGETEGGLSAVRFIQEMSPDVVVMDITMPDLNGIEITHQIANKAPGVKVLALSMHSEARFVVAMLAAGAAGYLLKDCAFEELAQGIRTVAANQTYLSPAIIDVVVKDYIHRSEGTDTTAFSVLTAREREVLQLLAEGKTTKEIALRLCLSVKTIETHRQQIMAKLNIQSIAKLTKYAIREGLTTLEM